MKHHFLTITYRSRKHTFLVACINGKIDALTLQKILDKIGVVRGTTYSYG